MRRARPSLERPVTMAAWLSVAVMAVAALAAGAAAAEPVKPNFVVIFVDDLGYGDIGPFGSKKNATPELDRMAAEGRTFTSFYAAAPVCTPSRAALMTGCYPKRVGLETGSRFCVLLPADPHGLSPDEITLPEQLKTAGYATACIGKWHLGDQPEFLPTRHGFDEFYGLPYSNDMWPPRTQPLPGKPEYPPLPLMRGEEVVGRIADMQAQAKITGNLTRAAVAFLARNRDRPFFLYLPQVMVHWPHAATEPFMAQSKNGVYGAAVAEVDWSVGEILDALRRLDLGEKTLVIFTSDNGGTRAGSNAPLRGGKGSLWEGGMREPTVVWWPGHVPAGSSCGEMATVMDFLPTFATLAGVPLPTDRVLDGHDMTPLLLGEPEARSAYSAFYYRRGAVRSGPWKYFANGQLYNLDEDIGETRDVAVQFPDVASRMKELLAAGRADLADPQRCRRVGKAQGPLKPLIPPDEKLQEQSSPGS